MALRSRQPRFRPQNPERRLLARNPVAGADAWFEGDAATGSETEGAGSTGKGTAGSQTTEGVESKRETKREVVSAIAWSGEIPPQKWMNFYTRVLAKFATASGLKLSVKVEVAPDGGVSQQKVEETRAALRELGLNDKLE